MYNSYILAFFLVLGEAKMKINPSLTSEVIELNSPRANSNSNLLMLNTITHHIYQVLPHNNLILS